MALGRNDFDTREQQRALDDALSALSDALTTLSVEAKGAAKIAARGKAVDLTPVYAAQALVRTTEEQCDIAALDLQTASGEDA